MTNRGKRTKSSSKTCAKSAKSWSARSLSDSNSSTSSIWSSTSAGSATILARHCSITSDASLVGVKLDPWSVKAWMTSIWTGALKSCGEIWTSSICLILSKASMSWNRCSSAKTIDFSSTYNEEIWFTHLNPILSAKWSNLRLIWGDRPMAKISWPGLTLRYWTKAWVRRKVRGWLNYARYWRGLRGVS